MTFNTPLWNREATPAWGREAEAFWVCFSVGDLADDIPLEVDAFGVPTAAAAREAEVRRVRRDDDPEWFDHWRDGAARNIAAKDLGPALELLDACDQCHTVRCVATDPEDLSHLQGGWALVRWFVARGAVVLLDVHAMRFMPGPAAAAVPPEAPFTFGREVSLILETDQREGAPGHCLHTRGMKKLGCPDLVTWVDPEAAEDLAEALIQLGEAMAMGWQPAPGNGVDMPDGQTLYLQPYEPEEGEDLHLNNAGLVLAGE